MLVVSVHDETIQIDESVSLTDPETFSSAELLCKTHGIDIADALQVVAMKKGLFSALAGDSKPIMVTADDGLAAAAEKEGLRVWNCRKTDRPEC